MAQNAGTYRRLPGRAGRNFITGSRQRLWLAKDHILSLRTRSFGEEYRRYYLGDIQAFICSETSGARTTNLVLGLIAASLAVLGLVALAAWPVGLVAAGLCGSIALVPILYLIANTLLGPTCVCRLHTAVQIEDLTCLRRLRTARRVIATLTPLIEAAQGRLSPEQLAGDAAPPATVEPSQYAPAVEAAAPGVVHHEGGRVHAAFFCALLVNAVCNALGIVFQHPLERALGMAVFAAVLILAALALRRQHQTDLGLGVKRITWAAGSWMATDFFFSYVYGMFYAVSHLDIVMNADPFSIHMEGPMFVTLCLVPAAVDTALAVTGLLLLRGFRAAHAAAQIAPTDASTPEAQ